MIDACIRAVSTSDADTYSYHTPWSCAQHPEVLQVRVYVCVQYSTGLVDVDRGIHERIHIFEKPLIECVSDLVRWSGTRGNVIPSHALTF
jgi:hypothetical protein